MATGIVINGDGTATWTISAADTATLPLGKIRANFKVWNPVIPAQDALVATFGLHETSGNRVDSFGGAVLDETGGTVGTVSGPIGLAASFNGTSYIRQAAYQAGYEPFGAVSPDAGATLALVYNPTAGMASGVQSLFGFFYYNSFPLFALGLWSNMNAGVYTIYSTWSFDDFTQVKSGPLVPALPAFWSANHLLLTWLDPAGPTLNVSVDLGTPVSEPLPDIHFNTTLGGPYWKIGQNLKGSAIAASAWNRMLTTAEMAGLSPYYDALYQGNIEPEGTLIVLDPSTALTSTPATWTVANGAIGLSESVMTQGVEFVSTLTITDSNGDAVDLNSHYVDVRLHYDPLGSSTPIQFIEPAEITSSVIITGTVRYTEYISGISPRPTPVWPAVTVELFDSSDNSLGTTTTDTLGVYVFTDATTAGVDVYIQVSAALPPGETSVEVGQSTPNQTAIVGTVTIDLTCDRPPI